MKKRSKPKAKRLDTPSDNLSDLLNVLAGLEHQLAISTYLSDSLERLDFLIVNGPPAIPPEGIRELENLRMWIDRTRRAIGPWREKLTGMQPALFEASNAERIKKRKLNYAKS